MTCSPPKTKIRLLLFLFSSLVLTESVWAQKKKSTTQEQTDLIEILVKAFHISTKPKPPDGKRVAFSIVPTTEASGGKRVLVSSINAAFIIGREEKTNLSSVFFLPYTDFSENFGFGLKYNIFTPKNKWNITGEARISTLTQYSFGLGSSSTESDRFRLSYDNIRFYATGNRKLHGNIFGGAGLAYDRNYNVGVSDISNAQSEFRNYGIGTQASYSATGISFDLLHDNRKNSINPADGLYVLASLRFNPSWLSNDNLWTSFYLDTRRYFRLNDPKRKIIAVSAFYWGSFGSVPYFNLSGTQLEPSSRSGRGYAQARFRGKHMLYAEGEYRFDISRNGLFGGVAFLNFQSISEPTTGRFESINPAIGFGGRIKFNKEADTNLGIDFGFGANSFSLSIVLGEWF